LASTSMPSSARRASESRTTRFDAASAMGEVGQEPCHLYRPLRPPYEGNRRSGPR
jgi:hypothetical protein